MSIYYSYYPPLLNGSWFLWAWYTLDYWLPWPTVTVSCVDINLLFAALSAFQCQQVGPQSHYRSNREHEALLQKKHLCQLTSKPASTTGQNQSTQAIIKRESRSRREHCVFVLRKGLLMLLSLLFQLHFLFCAAGTTQVQRKCLLTYYMLLFESYQIWIPNCSRRNTWCCVCVCVNRSWEAGGTLDGSLCHQWMSAYWEHASIYQIIVVSKYF